MGPLSNTWDPDTVLYGMYASDQPRNSSHINDPTLTAMLKAQRRTRDLAARKQILPALHRYVVETHQSHVQGL